MVKFVHNFLSALSPYNIVTNFSNVAKHFRNLQGSPQANLKAGLFTVKSVKSQNSHQTLPLKTELGKRNKSINFPGLSPIQPNSQLLEGQSES